MKHLGHIIFAAVLVIIAASCSSIPNKSVFESLDTKELAKYLMSDCQNVIEKLGTRF